ncbi:AAA family ATPase [Halopiger djelfimassiliensis]|uniref:AAA family ATPase n=1 Tax=Halopiger djelfimassiliensis TaxID=1293047 RepID=UPI0006781E14|nr:MoxR family ATPase [Halopiger djelfimassiliensis]
MSDKKPNTPQAIHEAVETEVKNVLIGNEEAIEQLTIAVLTNGHLLLEGVPGVAKTTLANLFAQATGLDYRRIQMTPDVLPADITGAHVYRENLGEFELRRGPIFTNVIVADEINRATPKTQSAFLEAMAEKHVTIEGKTFELPDPFMVVATQNPIEMEGVFELPEAQRDRFQFKLTLELPDRSDEAALLERFDAEPQLEPADIDPVVSPDLLLAAQEVIGDVHVAGPVKEYLLDLVAETRDHPDVAHGASPRASLTFLNGAKARAAIHGREYAVPDDVKALAQSVLAHRLVLSTEADLTDVSPEAVVSDIVDNVEVPDISRREETPSAGEASPDV